MVFTPIGRSPDRASEPVHETAPQRGHRVVHPVATPDTNLAWRAVVHMVDRDAARTAWHVRECQSPTDPRTHCAEGQHLLETAGDPDGHCLVNGRCARCELLHNLPQAA
jgi:hypothetical protein